MPFRGRPGHSLRAVTHQIKSTAFSCVQLQIQHYFRAYEQKQHRQRTIEPHYKSRTKNYRYVHGHDAPIRSVHQQEQARPLAFVLTDIVVEEREQMAACDRGDRYPERWLPELRQLNSRPKAQAGI